MSKRYISLKTAFTLAFLVVAGVPVWLAWQWPQTIATDLERERAREMHRVHAEAVAMALERHHRHVTGAFEAMADELQTPGLLVADGRLGMLNAFDFNNVCNFDAATGSLLGSFARDGRPCPEQVPEDDFEDTIRSIAVEGQVRYGKADVGASGQPMVRMVRRTGLVIAVGSLDTAYFRALAETVRFGEGGHAAIVDHAGGVLAHPKEEMENPPGDLSDVSVVQSLMAGDAGNSVFLSEAMGERMESAFRSVPGPGWGVMINQPQTEIAQAVAAIKSGTLVALGAAMLLAAALAMLASHVLLDPIKRVKLAAERLGAGSGDALIAPTGIGSRLREINDLRAAFNAMVLRIRKSQRTEIVARKEAQEATRIKSRFLANMSHELRTPLNAIIGFAEVLRRRLSGEEEAREHEYAGYIHDSGHHLLSIINDLLDLSRIEAGARLLDEGDVDVGEAIRDVRAMLGTTPEEKEIEVALHGTEDRTVLWADSRAVKQILLNLATNAVRYTPEGGHVTIGCERQEGGSVVLTVTDDGPGIPPEEMESVRTPFARGEAHEQAAVPGTGLGLPIVEALTDLHGGRFDLSSEPGKGTRARVVFPPGRALPFAETAEGTAAE